MSPLARPHPTTEGRRGSRIDLEKEGAIWVSPEIAPSERSRVSREPGAVQTQLTLRFKTTIFAPSSFPVLMDSTSGITAQGNVRLAVVKKASRTLRFKAAQVHNGHCGGRLKHYSLSGGTH
jgi:hypothetical protein